MDDDPFSYRPLKKRKVATCSSAASSSMAVPAAERSATLPEGATKDSSLDSWACSSQPGSHDGSAADHCVLCQMPLQLLDPGQTAHTHTAQCVEQNFDVLPGCPDGAGCESHLKTHYSSYNHADLARARACDSMDGQVERKPLKIDALRNTEGSLLIDVKVRQDVDVRRMCMRVPRLSKSDPVIKVRTVYKQTNIDKYFCKNSSTSMLPKESPAKAEAVQPTAYGTPPAKRPCPFYKKIAGTSYVVDAFSYGYVPDVTHYFLSHFHYDHYMGLSKSWHGFPIFCSPITARLVELKLKVTSRWICPLQLNQTHILQEGRIELVLLDANHCPGAVMFLFKFVQSGRAILHCGDFRATPQMELYPALRNCTLSSVHLDTTYCQPEYDFPSQSDVIQRGVKLIMDFLMRCPDTLICVGSYTIGKERLFVALAEAIDGRLWAPTDKAKVLKCLRDEAIDSRIVREPLQAQIHITDMSKIRTTAHLQGHLDQYRERFSRVLAVIPTGWTHKKGQSTADSLASMTIQRRQQSDVYVCNVPYSEHSSCSELKRFVQFLKLRSARQIIPTVNVGSASSRQAMMTLFHAWVSSV